MGRTAGVKVVKPKSARFALSLPTHPVPVPIQVLSVKQVPSKLSSMSVLKMQGMHMHVMLLHVRRGVGRRIKMEGKMPCVCVCEAL